MGVQAKQDEIYACIFEIRDLLKALVGVKKDGAVRPQGKVQELDTGKRQVQGNKVEVKPSPVKRESKAPCGKKDIRKSNNRGNSKPLDGKVPNKYAPPKRKRVGLK